MFGISNCGDHELVSKVEHSSSREHEALVEFLLYLAELDQRKLYLGLGYSSLFAYCTKKLKYSEPAAHRRILACRCIREFPLVLGALKDQAVSLTTIAIFSRILTAEYVSHDGTRCNARHDLEIDHIVPFSRGGLTEASNLRNLCSAHNRFESDRLLGAKTMAPYKKSHNKIPAGESEFHFGGTLLEKVI